jgi:hypothetical protein
MLLIGFYEKFRKSIFGSQFSEVNFRKQIFWKYIFGSTFSEVHFGSTFSGVHYFRKSILEKTALILENSTFGSVN